MLLFLWELPVENVYKEQQLIPWSPPRRGCIKVSTDSATMGNPDLAVTWGFLRNSEGRWLFEFNAYLGFCSSLHAELCVVYYGLRFAWEKVIGGWWWMVEVDFGIVAAAALNCREEKVLVDVIFHKLRQH